MNVRKLRIVWETFVILALINSSRPERQDLLNTLRWWEVNKFFVSVANNGLYTRDLQERLKTEFKWSEEEVDIMKLLNERKTELDLVFKAKTQEVKKLRDLVIQNYFDFKISKPEVHCCYTTKDDARDLGCFLGKGLETSIIATLPHKMLERMEEIKSVYASNNMLYFALHDGGMYMYPTPKNGYQRLDHCLLYEPHTRPWYELAQSPVPRDIVIFLDANAFENPETRNIAIAAAEEVINSLTQEDRFAVLNKLNLNANYKHNRHVGVGVWLVGTYRNRDKVISLLKNTTYHHSQQTLRYSPWDTVKEAIRMFQSPIKLNININRKAEMIVVQIVSGPTVSCLHSSIWEEEGLSEPLIISYVIGPTNGLDCRSESKEHFVVNIEKIKDLEDESKKFINFFTWSKYLKKYISLDPANDIRITLPYSSYYNQAIVITVALPIVIEGKFVGAIGCDISQLITLEHVTKLGAEFQDSYGFLIDESGRALSHPLLPSAHCSEQVSGQIVCRHPTYEDVYHLEQNEDALAILQSMVNMEKGTRTIDGRYVQSTGHALNDEQENPVKTTARKLAYAWVPLESIRLSFCIVIPVHNDKIFAVTWTCVDEGRCRDPSFDYHLEVDEAGAQNCSYFGADVSKDRGLVKFAPRAFHDPFDYVSPGGAGEAREDVILNAIRNDDRDFRSLLRGANLYPSVVVVEIAESIWKSDKSLECWIGVRYLGTTTGVFLSYPGITLNATYDHRIRPWYQLAEANRQPYPSISLTVPYRDFFSGREVMTVATPLEMPQASGSSFLVGVLGGDFSVEFLVQHLRKRLTQCDNELLSCFLLDTMGYIVLHLNEPRLTSRHITRSHPSLARDLVSSDLLTRRGCHDYEKDVVFLYWHFRMPDGVTTFFSGEGNRRAVIHKIPYTNVFLVARLASRNDEMLADEESAPDCVSTCSKGVECPCKVALGTECRAKAGQDMRASFDTMPACFPSDMAPTNKRVKKLCQETHASNTCYNSTRNEACALWEPTCFPSTDD